jgi:hypothetical protein
MIAGAIVIFFSKALNKLSGLLNVVKCESRAGQQHKCLFVPRLFVEDSQGGVPRLLKFTERQEGQAELELHFQIVRLELRGLLEQRIGQQQLALVVIDDAQLAQRHRIGRSQPEHVAILLLGLVILLGDEIITGARQMRLFGVSLLGTARTRDRNQGKREYQRSVSS